MFQKELEKIQHEFSGGSAFQHVSEIARYHRIQASPGFREAANYVCSTLNSFGISAEVLSFPARSGVNWWCESSFSEWDCEDAELVLIDGDKKMRLCSYRENKLSLIQRSKPTHPDGIETEVVYVETGDEPNSYAGLDVKGKIVFSRGNPTSVAQLAVGKHGALGIILDNMTEIAPIRDRLDLPDARQYTSFWPVSEKDALGFGFVLSPRQGEMIRHRFSAGKEVKVCARVDSRFYDGEIEVVSACIPGATSEETVAMAHLCHPQPSANDNASGSGTLIETARVLNTLIRSGQLDKPLRTIRFLWVPEMTGSYAYLASAEKRIEEVVSAINLDMVGENQDLCKGPLVVEKPPRSTPGFGGYLAESILRYVAKQSPNLAGTFSYALFKWAVSPFSGGSDHCIWSDPSVGVACPMLIQWPDKFYHTSEDTIDKVDPNMLKIVGTITGTYLYFSADMTSAEASWLAKEMLSVFPIEIYDAVNCIVKTCDNPQKGARLLSKRVEFLKSRCIEDLKSLTKFLEPESMSESSLEQTIAFLESTSNHIKSVGLESLCAKHGLSHKDLICEASLPSPDEWDLKAKAIVPKRLFRGPLSSRTKNLLTDESRENMSQIQTKWKNESAMFQYFVYWIDGNRSIFEIADLVEGEMGMRNTQALIEYAEVLRKAGLIETNPSVDSQM